MIISYIFSFLLPVILSLLITPLVIKFANSIGATDSPGDRKVHTKEMPRIGGLGIFLSSVISIVVVFLLFPDVFNMAENSSSAAILGFCFISLFAMGFWDDLKPLSPEMKFGIQLLLAAAIYFAGFKISNITNPLDMGVLNVEIIDFPLTILWIVGITNAFNLIDGLDGLSSGVAAIACIAIFTVSALSGQFLAAILSLIIAGALVGFLRYNFNPAKIFLGDSGSLIIGFALALLSIQSTAKLTTGFALLFPILVLALPITDTIVSMIRRFFGSYLYRNPDGKSQSALRRFHSMFTPDKSHIHHRLLSLGLSHRSTVLVLYGVSIFFAFSAYLYTQIDTVERSVAIAAVLIGALFLGIKKLRYREIAIFNNGLMMPFYEKWILNRLALIRLADIVFITASYWLSYALVKSINPATLELLNFENSLIGLLIVQFVVLWVCGLYREKMNQFGIGNVLNIIGSVGYAIAATAFVFIVMKILPFSISAQFLILDFYFLLTFVLGFRMTYQALSFWFNRDKEFGETVLIYGAGENGTMLLHKIINSQKNGIKVIGFLDDDPDLEGKIIYGYPILGGHWKLAKSELCKKIDSILICDEEIKCENLKRLKEMARRWDITIKKLNVSLQEVKSIEDQENESVNIMTDAPIANH
ncbi:MAG: hypothetical protein WD381_04650 [Balneolaceae bacterium]